MSMAHVHVRIDGTTKKKVQKILRELGLDMSTAVNLYFEQIVLSESIPFSISKSPPSCPHPICSGKKKVPDHIMDEWKREGDEALKEALRTGKFYNSAEELHTDILGKDYAK